MNQLQRFMSEKVEGILSNNRINADDIIYLLLSYDRILFQGQIVKKLEEDNQRINISFTKKRECLIKINGNEIILYFSEPILRDILKFQIKDLEEIFGEEIYEIKNRNELFVLYIEHNLIHLVLWLWNKEYPTHDFLFNCLSQKLLKKGPKKSQGMYVNVNNSCFLDSLMMILLFSTNNFIRDNLLSTKLLLPTPRVCPNENYPLLVRNEIKKDYHELLYKNKRIVCSKLRKLLSECLPGIGKGSYNTTEVYSLFTDIFPTLKISPLEYSLYKSGRYMKKGKTPPQALFQMWDFMEPPPEDGPFIEWEKVNSPILIFQNGLSPPIENFSSLKHENVRVWDPIHQKPVIKRQNKSRKFGEYILNGKYRLFGVILIHGGKPTIEGRWGGGHYTSFVRWYEDGLWHSYDDMGPTWRKYDHLPLILDTSSYSFPEMFFYERI